MATDFRNGKTFPRSGREAIGDALWLARIIDKGVLERWGIGVEEFEAAIHKDPSDGAMFRWLLERTTPDRILAANAWLLEEKIENLNRQDAEELGT